MSKDEITQLIWNELRLIACSTGLNAKRIVLIHESDIKKLVDKLDEVIKIENK